LFRAIVVERRYHCGDEAINRMTTKSIAVALVDDHTLFRQSLAGLIDRLVGYEVVLEAGNGKELIEALRGRPEVDIALVDLHMPLMDGFATIRWMRSNAPSTKVLALTFEKTEEAVVGALRAGACGFLLKDMDRKLFKEALDEVVAEGHYHRDLISEPGSADAGAQADHERKPREMMALVSERELEFIRLVCDEVEYTYDQVADRMNVHRRTVDGFREAVFGKLNVRTKAGLVLSAVKHGLLKV
jgi:two-component system, NarL family, invasion response regulator UvrY